MSPKESSRRARHKQELDAGHAGAELAVSPDGRTVVAASWSDGATPAPLQTVLRATDAGATWRKLTTSLYGLVDGPVILADGRAVLLAQPAEQKYINAGYQLKPEGGTTHLKTFPVLNTFAVQGTVLYGSTGADEYSASIDGGLTWSNLPAK